MQKVFGLRVFSFGERIKQCGTTFRGARQRVMSRRSIRWHILIAIIVLIALRIYFWGGPIRTKYRIVRAPEKLAGAAGQWVIERQGNNPQRWIARDRDRDGTWDEFATPEGTFTRPGVQSLPRRWLVVCVDGVPLTAMQSLWDRGHFREFFRPTATVSSFPADTETALTEVLHAAPVPGYEHRYYDRATNRMRGGPWVTLSGANIPYIRALNYDPPGWAKALSYIMPRKTYRADVGRFRKRFLGSRASVFLAHIAASDALLHLKTVEEVEPLLIEFENALREIYLDTHGDLGVIVFSDHGNTQTRSHSAPLEPFLTQRGWRVRESIEEPRDIAIPSYGLVGFAAIYCRPESIERLADELRRIEGADVIVSRHLDRKGATIRAAASATTAELEWTPDGRRYRYIARDGDPLDLVAVFDELRAAGKLGADGFASEGDLFAATSSASYPDSATRIRVWATNHVRSPADILVSFKPGYYHGARQFQRVVSFAGTHGGLEKSSSLGFAMATYPLAPTVRLRDLLPANLLERF